MVEISVGVKAHFGLGGNFWTLGTALGGIVGGRVQAEWGCRCEIDDGIWMGNCRRICGMGDCHGWLSYLFLRPFCCQPLVWGYAAVSRGDERRRGSRPGVSVSVASAPFQTLTFATDVALRGVRCALSWDVQMRAEREDVAWLQRPLSWPHL